MIRAALILLATALPLAAAADGAPQTRAPLLPVLPAGIEALRAKIGNFWNVAALDGAQTRVVLRVTFTPAGQVADVSLIESTGATPAETELAFQAARRAVLRAASDSAALPKRWPKAGWNWSSTPGPRACDDADDTPGRQWAAETADFP